MEKNLYDNDLENLGKQNSTSASFGKFKKLILGVSLFLLIIIIVFLFSYFSGKDKIEIPQYGKFGAKDILVPPGFPLPQTTDLDQEFEKFLGGLHSYLAIWTEDSSNYASVVSRYEQYMEDNSWQPVLINFEDGFSQISGKRENITLNIGIRKIEEQGPLEIQVNFSEDENN